MLQSVLRASCELHLDSLRVVLLVLFCFQYWRFKPLSMLGKHSTIELYPQPNFYSVRWDCILLLCLGWPWTYTVAQVGMLSCQPHRSWPSGVAHFFVTLVVGRSQGRNSRYPVKFGIFLFAHFGVDFLLGRYLDPHLGFWFWSWALCYFQ